MPSPAEVFSICTGETGCFDEPGSAVVSLASSTHSSHYPSSLCFRFGERFFLSSVSVSEPCAHSGVSESVMSGAFGVESRFELPHLCSSDR